MGNTKKRGDLRKSVPSFGSQINGQIIPRAYETEQKLKKLQGIQEFEIVESAGLQIKWTEYTTNPTKALDPKDPKTRKLLQQQQRSQNQLQPTALAMANYLDFLPNTEPEYVAELELNEVPRLALSDQAARAWKLITSKIAWQVFSADPPNLRPLSELEVCRNFADTDPPKNGYRACNPVMPSFT